MSPPDFSELMRQYPPGSAHEIGGAADILERVEVADRKPDLDEWFALETPHVSSCPGCGRTFHHVWETVERVHSVVVWPGENDPNMLRIAAEYGFDPVPYEDDFGPAVSWYEVNPT